MNKMKRKRVSKGECERRKKDMKKKGRKQEKEEVRKEEGYCSLHSLIMSNNVYLNTGQ
jgi:hypothetical protein